MTPLPTPIAKVLRDDFDRRASTRIWRGVTGRRLQRRQARDRRHLVLAFAAGVCAAVLLLLATSLTRAPRPTMAVEAPAAPLVPRAPVDWLAIAEPRSEPRPFEFTDGSRIVVQAGGRLAPLENTGRSVVFLLKDGQADFDVVPGGPRRWSIEAGFVTVEVVGTRFSVMRSHDRVMIEVEHGTVLVRGERVVDRVQRVTAGERLVIEREPPLSSVAPPPATALAPVSSAASEASRTAPMRPSMPAWRELAQEGAYAEAYRDLGADGIAARAKTADLEQLLALADVARLSGHARDAVEPLRRAMNEHAGDPRAAMAAFMLGRVHLDSLQEPSSAILDFRAAIALRLPNALLEDAYLRLIEAAAKADDRRAANEAWQTHRQLFPGSSRKSVADHWGRQP